MTDGNSCSVRLHRPSKAAGGSDHGPDGRVNGQAGQWRVRVWPAALAMPLSWRKGIRKSKDLGTGGRMTHAGDGTAGETKGTKWKRNRLTAAVLTGLSVFALACESDDAPADQPGTVIVQDSAGIEIVESMTPVWDGDGWTVAATPTTVIGRVSGDERYLFGGVNGAVVLRDGRIAVLDGQAARIRVYSADGDHIEDWGRSGEGPGEFSGSPRRMFPYRGDSILVEQFANDGSTIFDDRGRFGRTVPPEMWLLFQNDRASLFDPSLGPVRTCCTLWGPLPDGVFLGSYSEMLPYSGSGTMRSSVMAAITPDSGGTPVPAGIFKGGLYNRVEGGLTELQFQFRFSMAVGPDGYFVTEGDSYSFNAYDAGGRLRRIIRLAREPRPITDDIRAAHEARLREQTSPDDEWFRRELSKPYPAHLPAFESLHADTEGNLWARQRRYGADEVRVGAEMYEFYIFGADGRHLGTIELPANLEIYQLGADFILGRVRDELDVDYVHLYRIEK